MSFVLRRFAHGIAALAGISVVMFTVFFATPGTDPAARLAGKGASPALLADVRHQYGFDRPLPQQYARMMYGIFIQRRLSSYVHHGQNVVTQVMAAAPVTFSLVGLAAVMTALGSLSLGVGAALLGHRAGAGLIAFLCLLMVATPVFWLGEIVNMVTQGAWHDRWIFRWVPGLGYTPLSQDPVRWLTCLTLPAGTLSLAFTGLYARMLRAELLTAMRSAPIRTAWAKGAGPFRVWTAHALRLSFSSVIALFGMDFAQLAGGGALLVEVVFALPGIGHLAFEALNSFDLPLLMAVVMYAALSIVVTQALIDILLARLDPRLKSTP